jgi:hypothetical protein
VTATLKQLVITTTTTTSLATTINTSNFNEAGVNFIELESTFQIQA